MIPWATAATASALELPDLALASLRQRLQLADRLRASEHGRMAVSYVQIGQRAEALGWSVNTGEIYTIAGQLRPSSDIYTRQGMAFFAGDLVDRSSQAYECALNLDANNTIARVNYGWNLYPQGQSVAAERQFRQVLAQEPSGVAASIWALYC